MLSIPNPRASTDNILESLNKFMTYFTPVYDIHVGDNILRGNGTHFQV